MNKNYKKLAIFVAVMILTLSLASTGFAANTVANLKATYRNIRVLKNGVQAQFSNEPFIIDGTTYVPLRDMSEVLDKVVTWDNATSTISIQDKAGQNVNELYNQILTQQQTISQLELKIKSLEAAKAKEEEVVDLDDLEEELLDDYDELDKFDVEDIVLKGDEDDITVKIYIDLDWDDDDDYDDWIAFEDDADFEEDVIDFLQDIVDDILDVEEYEDADIEGFIEAEYSGDELISFTIDRYGDVELD